jgi:Rrf2 family transcriptional regulator, nitric oxide-sensitive transcriptional repressor
MRLTTFTDYSLRVLLYVATAPAGRANIAEIARKYGVSEHHIVKVVHLLGKEGLLLNTRGRGGGLRLARLPVEINVGSVVRITEEPSELVECFSPKGRCVIAPSCRLAGLFQEAHEAFYEVLDSFTLADLIARPRNMIQILHYQEQHP